jgi:dynein heavy chain, axonemal
MESKRKWMRGPIADLDQNEVEANLKTFKKTTQTLLKTFKVSQNGYRMAQDFDKDVGEMTDHLPAIQVLSNPGLRDRHWESIQQLMSIKFNYQEGCLYELINKGVAAYIPKIDEISENASKEFSLENQLKKMQTEWDKLRFVIVNYKNRGVLIL